MPHGWSAKEESSVEAPAEPEGAIKTYQGVALVAATENKRRAPTSARITTSNSLPLA
jgi:hypothetical protein